VLVSAAGWLFVIQRLFRSPKIRVLPHNLILHTLHFVVFWFLSLYRYFVNAVQPSQMMTQRPTWRVISATAARASCALIDSTSDIDITIRHPIRQCLISVSTLRSPPVSNIQSVAEHSTLAVR